MKSRKVDADGKPLPEEGNYPLKYLYDAFGKFFVLQSIWLILSDFEAFSVHGSLSMLEWAFSLPCRWPIPGST
jgi:hypothetical protein